MCGEHVTSYSLSFPSTGSSPRVWGAHCVTFGSPFDSRLIPTCVGSTSSRSQNHPPAAAHPHVCGEHPANPAAKPHNAGSSPRVWGARSWIQSAIQAVRLIPTCVGSTPAIPSAWMTVSAHPHVCGEHSSEEPKTLSHCGSSPRVWGARPPAPGADATLRLIPTCVGSTARSR